MDRIAAISCAFALLLAGQAVGQTDEQIASRLTPTVHRCEQLPENGGTFEQALCYKEEAARQDQLLNTTWCRVIRGTSYNQQVGLRQSERQWIKDRDEECHNEANDYINSTSAYMFNLCMANETIRRTMWLEGVLVNGHK